MQLKNSNDIAICLSSQLLAVQHPHDLSLHITSLVFFSDFHISCHLDHILRVPMLSLFVFQLKFTLFFIAVYA